MTIMDIEILEDGVVSIKTDKISDVHHVSADELLEELESLMGGNRETTKQEATRTVGRRLHKHHHVTGH